MPTGNASDGDIRTAAVRVWDGVAGAGMTAESIEYIKKGS